MVFASVQPKGFHMSTRAMLRFKDADGTFYIYQHMDGYPEDRGVLSMIEKAKVYAWPLPRFEADEFAAAYVVANKGTSGGNIRLSNAKAWSARALSDIEFAYTVTVDASGKLQVKTEAL